MTRQGFLRFLDELLEMEPGSLTGEELLQDLEAWDSLAVVGFIGLVDEQLGLSVSPDLIASCTTVDCLVNLVSSKLV